MVKNYTLFFYFFFLLAGNILSQEVKIFTIADFDLNGPVKSCLVSTNYGKEEYEFNKKGQLTKAITRYNDADYDITYYKYTNGELVEKRLENYSNKVFVPTTSMAHFYGYDSVATKKVTEKIISYNKEFLDQYEYHYDGNGRLEGIRRTNNDGVDEITLEYKTYKGEHTKTSFLNGVLQKSVRTSSRKARNSVFERIQLTKKYLEGEPMNALEEIRDESNRLLSSTEFKFDEVKKQFAPNKTTVYSYDESGALIKAITERDGVKTIKEYVYQYDGTENANWVKKIISPDNEYTTRKITYYEPLPQPIGENEQDN